MLWRLFFLIRWFFSAKVRECLVKPCTPGEAKIGGYCRQAGQQQSSKAAAKQQQRSSNAAATQQQSSTAAKQQPKTRGGPRGNVWPGAVQRGGLKMFVALEGSGAAQNAHLGSLGPLLKLRWLREGEQQSSRGGSETGKAATKQQEQQQNSKSRKAVKTATKEQKQQKSSKEAAKQQQISKRNRKSGSKAAAPAKEQC